MEIWKAVPGYEGLYEVSDRGRVRSLDRTVTAYRTEGAVSRFLKGKMKKQHRDKDGYPQLGLHADGISSTLRVHRLVLLAFVGPCPDGQAALHADGDTSNNLLDNLRWGTYLENYEDARRHGTAPVGEGHYAAKLTEADVRDIIRLQPYFSGRKLARHFGVSPSTVGAIQRGEKWRHRA